MRFSLGQSSETLTEDRAVSAIEERRMCFSPWLPLKLTDYEAARLDPRLVFSD